MALYAIGDLHLSFGTDKPMDVFGGAWSGYVDKLREGLSVIRPEDTTLLLGGEDDRVKGALDVIERVCKSRKQIATSPSPVAGTSGVYAPYPIEVVVGGATVFVLDVEPFVKF